MTFVASNPDKHLGSSFPRYIAASTAILPASIDLKTTHESRSMMSLCLPCSY